MAYTHTGHFIRISVDSDHGMVVGATEAGIFSISETTDILRFSHQKCP